MASASWRQVEIRCNSLSWQDRKHDEIQGSVSAPFKTTSAHGNKLGSYENYIPKAAPALTSLPSNKGLLFESPPSQHQHTEGQFQLEPDPLGDNLKAHPTVARNKEGLFLWGLLGGRGFPSNDSFRRLPSVRTPYVG